MGGTYVIPHDASSEAKMRTEINKQKAIASPITISIVSTCPASSGNATVVIQNTSQAAVSGTLQFVLKERGVKYSWPPRTFVDNVVRDMIPDDKGEAVTINAGQSITKTRAFSIGSGWVKDSCRLVAFVQKSNKEIIEACAVGVNTVTPILNGGGHESKTIDIRATLKSNMLYLPEKGKSSVSIMDIRGREIAEFSINSDGGWVQLPEMCCCGIVLLHIKTAQNIYREKIQIVK